MANLTCAQRLKVCHLRILRLDSSGDILAGADSLYEYTAPVSLAFTPTQPDRERFEQINGCGDQCALFIGSPKPPDGVDMTLILCEENAEVTELLAGGAIVDTATGGGNTIGYLSATDATVNTNGVAVEAWTWAWNGRQRLLLSGQPAFYRYTFPKTKWSVDQQTLENAIGTPQFTGIAETNTGFATGLAASPWPVSMGESVYGYFLTSTMPAAACGYQAAA